MRLAPIALACLAIASTASAAPSLRLVSAGGDATSTTVAPGTSTLSLDVVLDTDALPVSGVQFHVVTTAAGATYGTTPVAALGAPFVTGDLGLAPAASAAIDAASESSFFKSGAGDYAAVAGASIARLSFDTSTVAAGTYTFTPVFSLFSNATVGLESPSDFGAPGAFTLTIGTAPEPAWALASTLAIVGPLGRRRRIAH